MLRVEDFLIELLTKGLDFLRNRLKQTNINIAACLQLVITLEIQREEIPGRVIRLHVTGLLELLPDVACGLVEVHLRLASDLELRLLILAHLYFNLDEASREYPEAAPFRVTAGDCSHKLVITELVGCFSPLLALKFDTRVGCLDLLTNEGVVFRCNLAKRAFTGVPQSLILQTIHAAHTAAVRLTGIARELHVMEEWAVRVEHFLGGLIPILVHDRLRHDSADNTLFNRGDIHDVTLVQLEAERRVRLVVGGIGDDGLLLGLLKEGFEQCLVFVRYHCYGLSVLSDSVSVLVYVIVVIK